MRETLVEGALMTGLRSYELDCDHHGKSEFGLLLLRLRRRNSETLRDQAARLGYSVSYVKTAGSVSGAKLGRPSAAFRHWVIQSYEMTTNEYEAALGNEALGPEGE